MSSIIDEMCKLLGMRKLWTTPYHPQMNGLVQRSHQTIIQMIGKLGEDKKANWSGHLAEIAHTYNATPSAVTGYSPHYLLFGHRSRFLVDFYFPTFRSAEVPIRGISTKHVDEYVATVHDCLRATLCETQAQSMAEAQWQKWYYDQKIGTVDLKPGNLVIVKADVFREKRKIKDRWEDKPHKVVHQIVTGILLYKVKDQCGQSHILHHKWLLVTSETGIPLCVGVHQAQDRCISSTPVNPTPRGSGSKITPWQDSGLAITKHQARKTSLGWMNGKLWLLLWMSTGASTEERWRLQVLCSGNGCLQDDVHLVEGWMSQPIDAIK